ncbi:hypothetical protein [Vitiosangium sp. GDMCC 1.1324]|uniref:hypothetical protein n=1 Tax=Vitiosangium sp. (strain GDMCC 1.1324) TaxID=2138576 RepID=UPI0011B51629|nr:hypothetical protein [Vitiosangium sp. GDMCC 1.1324]
MKKNLLAASVFLFGLGLGGAAAASSGGTPGGSPPSITPEMAACIYACEQAGGDHDVCWACCVRNICPIDAD